MTGHDYRRYRFPKRTYRNQDLGPVHQPRDEPLHPVLPLRALLPGLRRRPRPRRLRRRTTTSTSAATRTACWRASSAATWSRSARPASSPTRRSSSTTRASGTCRPRRRSACTAASAATPSPASATARCGASATATTREVNGYFLCDRGRFGYEFVNRPERPRQPLLRSSGPWSGLRSSGELAPTPIAALERFAELLAEGKRLRHRLAARLPRVDLRARARGGRQRVQPRHRRRRDRRCSSAQVAILAARPGRERLARGRRGMPTPCWSSARTSPHTAPVLALALRQAAMVAPSRRTCRATSRAGTTPRCASGSAPSAGRSSSPRRCRPELDDVATRSVRARRRRRRRARAARWRAALGRRRRRRVERELGRLRSRQARRARSRRRSRAAKRPLVVAGAASGERGAARRRRRGGERLRRARRASR